MLVILATLWPIPAGPQLYSQLFISIYLTYESSPQSTAEASCDPFPARSLLVPHLVPTP